MNLLLVILYFFNYTGVHVPQKTHIYTTGRFLKNI